MDEKLKGKTYDDLFPSRFLKAADLAGDTVLTITDLQVEELGHTKDEKMVAYFQETIKALAMNKTNAKTVSNLYGAFSDWIGKRITLFPTDVSLRGEMVPAVRVRPRVPDLVQTMVQEAIVEQPPEPPPAEFPF